ncbi:MAG: hypothetical protein ACJAWO_000429 [Halieaceae bacterium]
MVSGSVSVLEDAVAFATRARRVQKHGRLGSTFQKASFFRSFFGRTKKGQDAFQQEELPNLKKCLYLGNCPPPRGNLKKILFDIFREIR